jgi:hypothetical protein
MMFVSGRISSRMALAAETETDMRKRSLEHLR